MNYSFYQGLLTGSINALVIGLASLLVGQWVLAVIGRKRSGQKLSGTSALPWWVRIQTASPRCVYYFGPFRRRWTAQQHQYGYYKDLANEQAQGIEVMILQDDPTQLTLCEE